MKRYLVLPILIIVSLIISCTDEKIEIQSAPVFELDGTSTIRIVQKCYYAVNASDLNWPTGMYIITVSNGVETYRSQLMINK